MALLSFFRKWDSAPKPDAPKPRDPAPSVPVRELPESPAPLADPAEGDTTDIGRAVDLFRSIQSVIGETEEVVRLPARILLRHLPVELRGPEWKDDGFPDAPIELEKQSLLEQLRRGRVGYHLNDLAVSLPSGWVTPDPDAIVELNLEELVEAIPPEWLQVDSRPDSDMVRAAQMRDFFSPAEPAAQPLPAAPAAGPPAEPAAQPLPAPAAGPPAEPAPKPLPAAPAAGRRPPTPPAGSWDGLDRIPDAGAGTLDLNRAGIGEIAALPAMGLSSARRIVEYRAANGPFRGIYDLLLVPGVGPRVFHRMSGLDHRLRRRFDRHETLNGLLGLPPGARPPLQEIAGRTADALGARGCVLAGGDGMALAESEGLGETAERLAALSPKLFRRTRRYLRQIAGKPVCSLSLPETEPPLLFILSAACHTVIVQPDGGLEPDAMRRALEIAREIEWLLSRRAIVQPAAPAEPGREGTRTPNPFGTGS